MRILRSTLIALSAVAVAGASARAAGVGGAAGAVAVPHATSTTVKVPPPTTSPNGTSQPASAATNGASTSAANGNGNALNGNPASGGSNVTGAAASTNASTLPPPPPASVDPLRSSNNTIAPTPAPATAGLPSTPPAGALPSNQGLPANVENERRPSPSLSATQVADVQAALAAGGLYRGPIDGNMSGSLRASVAEFQRIARLPQTGNLDQETLARLTRASQAGGSAAQGTTSTAGNLNASQPFSTTVIAVPTASSSTPATATTPFSLSAPINTSPTTPPSVLIQP